MNVNNEKRSNPMATKSPTFTLYGNLGGDPQMHHFPEKTITRNVYDHAIAEVVEREFPVPARDLLTFSLAVQTKEMRERNEDPTWFYCVDWKSLCSEFRQGDRVRLHGYLEDRTYERDGETKTSRQYVVLEAQLMRAKQRDQEAA